MTRTSKRLLIGVGLLALALAGAYVALVQAFPPQRIGALVAEQVSQRTGRHFRIQGALDYRVLPRIAVVAEDLALANAPWASRPDMLRVQRAALQLELWPMLQGQVKIGNVSLDGVDLLLETNAQGDGNWQMPGLAQGAGQPGTQDDVTRSLDLAKLSLRAVQLAYLDGVGGTQTRLNLKQLDLVRNAEGYKLDAQWLMKDQGWQLDGQLGRLESLLANQAAWPFTLALRSTGAQIDVAAQLLPGVAPRTGRFDIDARMDKVAALAPWVSPAAHVPLPIALKTTLQLTTESLHAEPLRVSVAGQAVDGSLRLRNGSPWQMDGRLNADTIDLKPLLPARVPRSGGTAAPGKRLFDDTPLPIDTLPEGRASLELRIGRLLLPDAPPLSALKANIRLQAQRLKVEPLEFGVAEGQVRGSLTLNTGTGTAPRVQLQLDGSGLSAEALARAAGAGSYLTGGHVQLKTALSMAGHTQRALAAGVNGELLLSVQGLTMGDGTAPIGPNLLPRLLSAVTLNRQVAKLTQVECAVARLPFKNGVAQVERSIAIETPDLAISAVGYVDLRDETLELAFRPTSKGALGLNPAQLASLVMAKGPILAPAFTLDAKGAAGMALSIGAAVASGGLSILAENLVKQANDPHPCRYAATGMAAEATAPAPSAKPAKPASTEPSLPGFLRKIFR